MKNHESMEDRLRLARAMVQPSQKELSDLLEPVDFVYPEEAEKREAIEEYKQKVEERLMKIVISILAITTRDHVILKERILYRKSSHEIEKLPYLEMGRRSVVARCHELAKIFPMLKGALLARFETEEKGDERE